MPNTSTVPVSQVRAILKVAEAQGYNVGELLRSVGLAFDPLELSDEDRSPEIPADIYNRLYTRIIWLLQDESFGLNMKQKLPAGSFRMLCLCTIHAPNLRAAILRTHEFTVFCRNLAGLPSLDFTPLSFSPDAKSAFIHLPANHELFNKDATFSLMNAANLMMMWWRFLGWLIGDNIELQEVCFQSPEPAYHERISSMFKVPLRFSQTGNGFRFHSGYLDCLLVHDETSLNKFLISAPYQLTASELPDERLSGKMRAIVGSDLGKAFPSISEMAAALNISVRTLRRRLADEGLSYQSFKDTTRREAAEQYLNRTELKINAVAALLGFDEPSSFHRSFKKWTGMTPGEYRNKLAN